MCRPEFERGQVVQVDSVSLDGRTFVKASGSLEALPPWFTAAASLLPTHAKKEGQIVGRGKILLIGNRQAVWDSWAITDDCSRVATV